MASLMKRVIGSIKGRSSPNKPAKPTPVAPEVPCKNIQGPPSPDLSALRPDELHILNEVFRRQTEFEQNEIARIERIRVELEKYEDMIRNQSEMKKKVKHVDLRLCRLCYKTKFADGIGRICYDCHKRVCGRCGSFTRPRWNTKKNKSVRGKWRCNMCQLKRETLCKTGQWYGGAHTPTGQVMMKKISFYGTETESDVSDLHIGPSNVLKSPALKGKDEKTVVSNKLASQENDNDRIPLGNLTDSELIRSMDSARNANQLSPKRARRCSLPVSSTLPDEDEDDLEDNEEELQRERLLFRQKRQQRKWRRRYLPDVCQSEESTVEMTSDTMFSSGLSSEDRKRPKLKSRYRSLPKLQLTTKQHSRSKVSSDSMTDDSSALSFVGKDSSLSDCANSPSLYSKMKRQDAVYCSSSSSLADVNGNTSSPLPPRHSDSKMAAFRAVQSCCYNLACKEELLSRRVTLSQCENIEICQNSAFSGVVSTVAGNPHEVILHKDASDPSRRTKGLGMRIVGGQESDNGEMGAYVSMVIKGGPADVQGGIKEGDQILEVDGQSLVGVTFEEARAITDKTGNVVQLVVIHQVPSIKAEPEQTRVLKTGVSFALPNPPISKPRRRMLPPTPIEIKKIIRKVSGKIQVQINYSISEQLLSVTLLKGEDIGLPEGSKRQPTPFAMVHILPQRTLFDFFETEDRKKTRNPEWNSTFQYIDIDEIEVRRLSVEVTIWSQQLNGDVFVGEVLLDLKDRIPEEPIWYDLQDHDDNSSPLPDRKSSIGDISEADILIGSQDKSENQLSVHRSLPSTPSYEHTQNKMFVKMQTVGGIEDRESPCSTPPPGIQPDATFNPDKRQSLSKKMKQRMSIAVSKVSLTLSTNDHKQRDSDGDGVTSRKLSRGISLDQPEPVVSPRSRRLSSVNLDMLAPPLPLSSRRSSNSSHKSENPSENDEEYLSNLPESPENDEEDVGELVSSSGPGQLTPKQSLENDELGDVKLGFIIKRGQLEVDIYCARNLQSSSQASLDTYVKTYLVEGKKIIQKKKTSLIKGTKDPQYRSKIKYSAANVHGRHMRITVWEKCKGFEKKICIGEAVVKLDNLQLSQHNIAWYKLYRQNATSLGSNDSLHW